jgi:hypothetical protein
MLYGSAGQVSGGYVSYDLRKNHESNPLLRPCRCTRPQCFQDGASLSFADGASVAMPRVRCTSRAQTFWPFQRRMRATAHRRPTRLPRISTPVQRGSAFRQSHLGFTRSVPRHFRHAAGRHHGNAAWRRSRSPSMRPRSITRPRRSMARCRCSTRSVWMTCLTGTTRSR